MIGALLVAISAVVGRGLGPQLRPYVAARVGSEPVESHYLTTTFYKLRAVYYNDVVLPKIVRTPNGPAPFKSWGGAITPFGDRFLLALGDGRLFRFDLPDDGRSLKMEPLALTVPIDVEAFLNDVDSRVETKTFRVADVLVQPIDAGLRLFATHHDWNVEDNCSVVRVSVVEGSIEALMALSPPPWRTLFETSPCLPLKDRGVRFGGLQIGGKMVLLDPDTLLVTIGDHEFDGYYGPWSVARDPASSYGKILRVSIADGTATIHTMGHRTPSGLYRDRDGTVWETEHGPKGGDELNLIRPGGDYGWPDVSYGTAYDKSSWPPNPRNGWHDGFDRPVFAWVPSIGVSALTAAGPGMFDLWQGDLLVGSLTNRGLWRLRLEDHRVVYAEQIPIGCRIRDLIRAPDGRLLLWCDDQNTLVSISEPDPRENGELLFAQCEGCHSIDMREKSLIGPDLRGVAGRRIAAKPGFDYSPALKAFGDRRWTERDLDRFLVDPQAYAPGTTMTFAGIADARERAAVVRYLLSVRE
jgi:cytochrome c2